MIQLIKKNHKLIDILSVSMFIFCLTMLVLLYILNKFNINEYILIVITLILATIVSKVFTKRLNIFLHSLFNFIE